MSKQRVTSNVSRVYIPLLLTLLIDAARGAAATQSQGVHIGASWNNATDHPAGRRLQSQVDGLDDWATFFDPPKWYLSDTTNKAVKEMLCPCNCAVSKIEIWRTVGGESTGQMCAFRLTCSPCGVTLSAKSDSPHLVSDGTTGACPLSTAPPTFTVSGIPYFANLFPSAGDDSFIKVLAGVGTFAASLTVTINGGSIGNCGSGVLRGFRVGFGDRDTSGNVAIGAARKIDYQCALSPPNGGQQTTACGFADPHYQGFDGTSFEFMGRQGAAFNIISHKEIQLNSWFDRHVGPDEWPYWGTWMTAFGLRSGDNFTLAMYLDTTQERPVDSGKGGSRTRMRTPAGGFRPLVRVVVNGEDQNSLLESGTSKAFDGHIMVYFPREDQKNPSDPTDGPVVVISTGVMEVTFYLESEEALHLDLTVKLKQHPADVKMHGVLGQTLDWAVNRNATNSMGSIEGKDEDYEVRDGLLGRNFKYNLFGSRSAGRSMFTRIHQTVEGFTASVKSVNQPRL